MWGIMQSAKCMARYDKISHEILAELLISIVIDGKVIGENNRGSDVKSPAHAFIEVKSRILGTDGQFPRVSLKQHNIEKADWFAAVRWTREYTLDDAVMLPKSSACVLYEQKKQSKGLAHISWTDWTSSPGAESLRDACIKAINKFS